MRGPQHVSTCESSHYGYAPLSSLVVQLPSPHELLGGGMGGLNHVGKTNKVECVDKGVGEEEKWKRNRFEGTYLPLTMTMGVINDQQMQVRS